MTCLPNRALGARAQFAIQEETCWGSLAENQTPIGVEVASETLGNPITKLQSELIRGDRMRSKADVGEYGPGGDIIGELQPHGCWPLLLRHALGGAVTTSGSGPYTHIFDGATTLPEGLTIQKRNTYRDNSNQFLRLLGCRVNQLSIEVPNRGKVRATASVIAKQVAEAETTMGTPVFPAANSAFNFFQGALTMDIDGSGSEVTIATVKSMSLQIANGISGDEYAMGSRYRGDVPEDERVISGEMTIFYTKDRWALYQSAVGDVELSLTMTLTSGSYSMTFAIPALTIGGDPVPKVSGRGPQDMQITWEAHRDDTLNRDIRATIVNADSGITTAAA